MTGLFDQISNKIDSYKEEMLNLQKGLVAIPALAPQNGGDGEMKKALFMIDYLKNIGIKDIQRYDAPDERVSDKVRPNFVAKIKGKDSSRTFWIMVHLDVVPPGDLESWTNDPYELKIDGDLMIGRGVEDNHQGIISGVFALKSYLDLGIVPEYDTGLIFVSDEETGSRFGIDYLLKNADVFKKDDLILVPDAGEAGSTMIEVAEKSILWMKITTVGSQCHASTPELGVNAHKAACHLVVELESLYKKFPERDEMYDTPESTFEPTRKLENVPSINVIPGEDVIFYDCRILPQYNTNDIIAYVRRKADDIEKKFGVEIEISFPQHVKAAKPTPVDAPIVQMLKKGIKDIYKAEAKPMGIGGGTVAAFFRSHGYNAAVWSTIDDTCHQPDESARISFMIGDTRVFAHLMMQKI